MKKRLANNVNGGNLDYYQNRIDTDDFKGYVCLLDIHEVEKAWFANCDGHEVCFLDTNYKWLEIYPDNENYSITVMYDENYKLIEWYFDIVKNIGLENNIPYIDDMYLDLVVRPNKEYLVLDEDELYDALNKNEITKDDVDIALKTLDKLIKKYVEDFSYLEEFTNNMLDSFEVIKFEFEEKNNRVVLKDKNKEIGECDFLRLENDCLNIIHTGVNSKYQGKGFARKLVESVLDYAKTNNLNVIAECSYAIKILNEK